MTTELKDLKALPRTRGRVKEQAPPPLEYESPGRKLSRLTTEHAKTTEELQKLKRDWAAENMAAAQARMPIATSRLTWVEKRKGELAKRIADLQTEIGATNKAIREDRAGRQNGHREPEPPPAANGAKKKMPLAQHPDVAGLLPLGCSGRVS